MANIPTAQVKRILKENGVERSSADAKLALKENMLVTGADISRKAAKLAKHAGRKTVQRNDIELALE